MSENNKNKLVTLGALDQVARKLKEAANQAAADAAAEKDRAMLAEKAIDDQAAANAAAIAKLNGGADEEGSVAKAVADEASRAVAQEGALDTRIKALEGIVSGDSEVTLGDIIADVNKNAEAIETLNGDADTVGSVAKAVADAVKAEKERAEEVEGDHDSRITAIELVVGESGKLAEVEAAANANAEAIEILKGGEDVDGSVAKAVKVAKDAADAADGKAVAAQADVDAVGVILNGIEGQQVGLIARVEANEEAIEILNGGEDVEDSVKKQIKDAIDEVNQAADGLADRVETVEGFVAGYEAKETKVREDFAAADATNLQAAKDYADQQITALVDAAPEAMNTLNELAQAIKGNEDIYKAYVEEHAQAMNQMKSDLQTEIDNDVATEAGLREAADNLLQEAINAKVAKADYDVKIAALEAKDAALEKAIGDNKTAQDLVNDDFEGRIADNEAFVGAQPAIDEAQNERLTALETANAEGGDVANAIKAAKDAADAAQDAADAADKKAVAAQADVDAIEGRLDNEGGLVDRLEAAEANIIAEAKVGGARDLAIEAALDEYDTEVRAMLAAVIQSLGVSIDDNKLKLTLGTSDYVINEVSLNVASEEDINILIADLEQKQGE